MKSIIGNILLIGIAAMVFAACSTDDEPAIPETGQGGVIMFGSSSNGDIAWQNGRTDTRSSRAGGEVESTIPNTIGVFAFGDGRNTTYVFNNRKVYNEDGRDFLSKDANGQTVGKFAWTHSATSTWPYTEDADEKASIQKPWEAMHYRFFAYSPWYETKNVRVSAENYSGFNTFTWDNIPGFSGDDFVLANEIIDLDNTAGDFTTAGNVVHFRMRHILSRIRFFFKMSPAYRELRQIELNSITVLTAGKVKTATFNFKNNEWDETVHWSNEQIGDADPVTLVNADNLNYKIPALSAGLWPAEPYSDVYVYPQADFDEIKLRMNYTVYDRTGQKTRAAEVTNIITLPNWTLLSGYYYDIKINIVPDYLYVLSDNDQDMDGYVLIKDQI